MAAEAFRSSPDKKRDQVNSRRTVIIAAALILAALAFAGNVVYLKGAQKRAYNNAQLVQVYKVNKEIPKGLTGDQAISQNFVGSAKIPQEFYPGTAVKDIGDIKSKVAINALPVGALILNGQFVPASVAQVTTAQQVEAGNVAVTISVDQVHGVAGLLMPGDKVNMILVGADKNDEDLQYAQVLYQNVKILAIGTKTAPQAGDTSGTEEKATTTAEAGSGLITFTVPLDAAQRIALATSGGSGNSSLYLTLVPPDAQPVSGLPRVDTNSLFNNLPLTPYDGK
jgi:pilus assembly protein CpaB